MNLTLQKKQKQKKKTVFVMMYHGGKQGSGIGNLGRVLLGEHFCLNWFLVVHLLTDQLPSWALFEAAHGL